jgi:glycoside/pentoside/hexuronide:cation symporter, GPH family
MPAAGSHAQFAILLADLSVVTFIGTSGFIVVTSMVADIVEETELRTGRRSEGLLLAADTFLKKLSAGMAIVVPGLLLTLVAFPPHGDPAMDVLMREMGRQGQGLSRSWLIRINETLRRTEC